MWILLGAAGLLGWVVLAHWVPSGDPRDAVCLSRRFLNFSCPGCGLTRALALLAKGQWEQAWTLHPLAPFLAGEAIAAWFAGLVVLIRGHIPDLTGLNRWLWIHLAALIGIWVVRLAEGTLP